MKAPFNLKYIISYSFFLIAIIMVSCDIYQPKTSFRFAVPEDDYLYVYMYAHLKPLLEQHGYQISVVHTERNIEANRLVAEGKADLAFANNVSAHIADALDEKAVQLRTILPLTQRAVLGYTHVPMPDSMSVRNLFEDKTIGIELLNGEGHNNIKAMLARARISYSKIVQSDQDLYDVRLIWGSSYGKRAMEMLDSGWHAISFPPEWIDFQTLMDPALDRVTLPALPGADESVTIQTVATTAVLVGNKNIGENAIYRLAETIMQNRLALIRQDPMYHEITESIDRETLLYPLHEGTSSYLRRDTPTFLERYADSLALVISVFLLLYGVAQAVKNYMMQVKKDHIDEYFLEFLDIRSKNNFTAQEQVDKLNDLLQRALIQMTKEKMDKNDFHIFSRLIQQELTNLRIH